MGIVHKKLKNLTAAVDSRLDTQYRIGMRVVKTAAAVMICLLIAMFVGGWTSIPISVVSAIVTIQPTRGETVRSGGFRILGTVIGGVIGTLTVIIGLFLPYYTDGLYVIVIPFMLLLDLYLCNVLKMQDTCTISCVVTVLVAVHIDLDATVGGAFIFTLIRLRDTLIGVVAATIMNVVPHYVSARLNKRKESEEALTEDTSTDPNTDT